MSRKAVEAEAPENHERWIVSYADMVTLLWALFVVLYALSDSNPRKLLIVSQSIDQAFNAGVLNGSKGSSAVFTGGAGGLSPNISEVKSNNLASLSKKLAEFSNRNQLDGKIQVRSDANSITISLADNLLFDSGHAELKPGSQVVLAEVAALLRTLPNQLRIEGHTDNVPVNSVDFATNWELSANRASTVLRFLSEQGKVAVPRMFLAGYAETHPISDNATPEGRALNRRADIVIVYPTQEDIEIALAGARGR